MKRNVYERKLRFKSWLWSIDDHSWLLLFTNDHFKKYTVQSFVLEKIQNFLSNN